MVAWYMNRLNSISGKFECNIFYRATLNSTFSIAHLAILNITFSTGSLAILNVTFSIGQLVIVLNITFSSYLKFSDRAWHSILYGTRNRGI